MPYKLNPFSGTLDYYKNGSGSGVTRVGNTTNNHITRWDGTNADTIKNSLALVQDGGAVVAQGHITNKLITEEIVIGSDQCMVTSGFSIELTGELVIEADGELVVV